MNAAPVQGLRAGTARDPRDTTQPGATSHGA